MFCPELQAKTSSPLPQPLHILQSIVARKPGMAVAPTLAPALAPQVHGVAMAQMVEGRNTGADHDHRAVPDTLTGLWDINDTRL